ncbi:hypothetical protein P7C71_g4634, partial [Lecanoromycetidae sp. Uapishka_2]
MPSKAKEPGDQGSAERPGPAEVLELGPHWTNLRNQAREALITETRDVDMEEALETASSSLARIPRGLEETNEDVSVRLVAAFLDRVGTGMRANGFDAHEAVMYMTEALWDIDVGMNNFLAQQAEDSARESEEVTVAATGETVPEESEIPENISIGHGVNTFVPSIGGAAKCFARIGFHDEEIQWLIDYHYQYKCESVASTGVVNWQKIKWDDVTRDFNAAFAGRTLIDSPTPRPTRTKSSLTTERYRIKTICDLVELKGRNARGRRNRKGVDEEQDPEEGKEEEESDQKE